MAETITFDILARDLASKAFGDAGKSAEGFAGKLTAIGGIATGVVGVGLTKLGEHLEETRKTLEQTIADAGQSFDEFSKQIDQTAGHEEKFGHSTADTNDALSILTRATGDTGKALSDMSLVTEIAAAHHSSLAEAADTVARMHGGAMRSLKEFGISTADVSAEAERLAAAHGDTAKEEQFAAAQTLILQKIHGTAEAQADTFGGKIKALKTHFMDMAAELGTHVGPALTVAGPLLLGVGQIISSGVIPMVVDAAAGFASMAVAALTAFASMIAEAAVWAASMVASAAIALAPFLPIIAAAAALGFAAYELYEHWDQVWGFIKAIAGAAAKFITDHLNLILVIALGPLGVAIDILKEHWAAIWNAVSFVLAAAWGIMKPIFDLLVTGGILYVHTMIRVLRDEWNLAWAAIHTYLSVAWSIIQPIFHLLVDGGILYVQTAIDLLKAEWDFVWGAFHLAVETMWSVVQPILGFLKRALDDIVGPLEKVAGAAGGLISGAGSIAGSVGGFLGFADGGYVPGAIGQPQLAVVHGGELVLNPSQQRAGFGGSVPMVGELHVHTSDDPRRISLGINQTLRDAAFLMGV